MPRASQAWLYAACPAVLHKMRRGDKQEDSDYNNKYMAFGSIAHHDIQAQLGCTVPDVAPDDLIEAEPMLPKLRQVVSNAVSLVKAEYGDAVWHAEREYDWNGFTGHTDLECDELSTVIDIKTTSKLPSRGTIAVEHYWQLLAYRHLTNKTKLRILYVHSGGDWTVLSEPITFTARVETDFQGLLALLDCSTTFWHSYGGHCAKCPFCKYCRDVLPGVGEVTKPVEFRGGSFAGLGL